jgi:hypothetical protein
MPCRLAVSLLRADGSCSVTGHSGAQQDVHLQLLLHVAVGAFLCPGRRPRFHHHDLPTDAAARLTDRLSGFRFWPLSKPTLSRPMRTFALGRDSSVSIVTRLQN